MGEALSRKSKATKREEEHFRVIVTKDGTYEQGKDIAVRPARGFDVCDSVERSEIVIVLGDFSEWKSTTSRGRLLHGHGSQLKPMSISTATELLDALKSAIAKAEEMTEWVEP